MTERVSQKKYFEKMRQVEGFANYSDEDLLRLKEDAEEEWGEANFAEVLHFYENLPHATISLLALAEENRKNSSTGEAIRPRTSVSFAELHSHTATRKKYSSGLPSRPTERKIE